MAWLKKAWAWTKTHWWYFLVALGGFLLWLTGRLSGKRTITVTNAELEKHDEVARKIEAQAAEQRAAADAKAEQQLAGVEAAHSAAVTAATQKRIDAAEAAADDPDKVNELLKKVGKDVRG